MERRLRVTALRPLEGVIAEMESPPLRPPADGQPKGEANQHPAAPTTSAAKGQNESACRQAYGPDRRLLDHQAPTRQRRETEAALR